MLIITGLSMVYFYRGVLMYKTSMSGGISETTRVTAVLIDDVIQTSNQVYSIHLNNILNDHRILSAFARRDRKELFAAALPFHTALKNENPYYSNMHFHLPDGFSFLRLHKPKEYGDDLRQIRPIIMKVHQEKKSVYGYEVGKHGLFYRVAKPVFFRGRYIGALELGIKAEQAAANIEQVLNLYAARMIRDDRLNESFRGYCKNEIRVHGMSVNPYDHKRLFFNLLHSIDPAQLSSMNLKFNNKDYVVFKSGNLKDYQNRTVARFLIVRDITTLMAGYQSFLFKSVWLTLILIVCAYIILRFSFGVYVQKIITLNKTLEKRVRNRTKDLEEVTDQLKATNAQLSQIFNTAADGMRVIDRNFQIIRVNDTFAKLMGKDKEVLENQYCHENFKGAFCHSPDCTLKRIINGEKFLEINVDKKLESGEIHSFLLTATPYISPSGQLLGVVENFKDITEHRKMFLALKDHERYLNAVMGTVQAGVIITDEKSARIIDANPFALKMIGCSKSQLKNSNIRDHFSVEKEWIERSVNQEDTIEKEDFILTTATGRQLNIRLSRAKARIKGKKYLVQSFSDISDVKRLIKKQMVDIRKAKSIMDLINPTTFRYAELPNDQRLFTTVLSIPCNAEGGDHFFVHHLKDPDHPKTVVSLKDQSGHEVNCILRSIYTDIVHHWVMFRQTGAVMDQVITRLNHLLCESGFFEPDDFFTLLNVEIDHKTLMLQYISAGHPPFLLIRNKRVMVVPETGREVSHLPIPFLENARYVSTAVQLEKNDQLIFYTDGLSEMPVRLQGPALTAQQMVELTQGLLDAHYSGTSNLMPVSDVMLNLLDAVAGLSREIVKLNPDREKYQNTSDDDVTLMGVELETLDQSLFRAIRPETSEDISAGIEDFVQMIFQHKENQAYLHLKNRMTMILEEAVVNAWKHGNKKAPDKDIVLGFKSSNDFVFQVIDQGEGFDYRELPDPRSPENIDRSSGRGLFIVRHFSDHVVWKNNGSHIIISLKKIKEPDDREKAGDIFSDFTLWERT